ncbi:hypothetical protein [Caulobacter sp. NIBR2454]|uniref:hypothetical protein n=1 Tax=Caulobacter sp. NIBR2454 TaxID=3015996 RepID=UPI0022B6203A|nr:hypothetical protein [Caulobacter sp. NIBR2454]
MNPTDQALFDLAYPAMLVLAPFVWLGGLYIVFTVSAIIVRNGRPFPGAKVVARRRPATAPAPELTPQLSSVFAFANIKIA